MIKIDELEIRRLCKKYDIKYKIFDNEVMFYNKTKGHNVKEEKWIAEIVQDERFAFLKHESNTEKNHFHYQRMKDGRRRPFYDWEFLIKSIKTHRKIRYTYNHVFKMKELFSQIHN
jgi:hypothetical protein